MTPEFKSHLSKLLNKPITKTSSISDGDISAAYKIETGTNCYFLKVNNKQNALNMFQMEALGLQSIQGTNTIKTPKVIACHRFHDAAFLLLEFIESKSPSPIDFENLGHQLAALHQCTSENFGLNNNNFIGSLLQSNTQHKTWLDFYTHERLLPQLKLAKQKHLLADNECPTEQQLKTRLKPLLKDLKPALLHGDLWSGNYLISKNGTPYLIDPAVYYGHHEVDIAMSKLFGGFGNGFYEAYRSHFVPDNLTPARMEIYQLYYLLVHLNMFGSSYYGSVISILKKYF